MVREENNPTKQNSGFGGLVIRRIAPMDRCVHIDWGGSYLEALKSIDKFPFNEYSTMIRTHIYHCEFTDKLEKAGIQISRMAKTGYLIISLQRGCGE